MECVDMNRVHIILWGQESGLISKDKCASEKTITQLEAFANLVAAHERNTLAAWMIQFGFATGHGDTMEELVDALGTEIVDRIDGEVDAEREAIAADADWCIQNNLEHLIPERIRARK
jgi:hypothetical protein